MRPVNWLGAWVTTAMDWRTLGVERLQLESQQMDILQHRSGIEIPFAPKMRLNVARA
jgi:hypothetical protein